MSTGSARIKPESYKDRPMEIDPLEAMLADLKRSHENPAPQPVPAHSPKKPSSEPKPSVPKSSVPKSSVPKSSVPKSSVNPTPDASVNSLSSLDDLLTAIEGKPPKPEVPIIPPNLSRTNPSPSDTTNIAPTITSNSNFDITPSIIPSDLLGNTSNIKSNIFPSVSSSGTSSGNTYVGKELLSLLNSPPSSSLSSPPQPAIADPYLQESIQAEMRQASQHLKEQEEQRLREQEAQRRAELQAKTKEAEAWLKQLDRLSSEGLWFEQFARKYPSEVEAALEFLFG